MLVPRISERGGPEVVVAGALAEGAGARLIAGAARGTVLNLGLVVIVAIEGRGGGIGAFNGTGGA